MLRTDVGEVDASVLKAPNLSAAELYLPRGIELIWVHMNTVCAMEIDKGWGSLPLALAPRRMLAARDAWLLLIGFDAPVNRKLADIF